MALEYDDPSLTVLARIILFRGTITLGLVDELPRLVNVELNGCYKRKLKNP